VVKIVKKLSPKKFNFLWESLSPTLLLCFRPKSNNVEFLIECTNHLLPKRLGKL
jgi:hypothetical protein